MKGEYCRLNLSIQGRVQGVFYRASAAEKARSLGVQGWVRNVSDGSVELLAEGRKSALQELLEWCHEGPPAATVTQIKEVWSEAQGLTAKFEVRATRSVIG